MVTRNIGAVKPSDGRRRRELESERSEVQVMQEITLRVACRFCGEVNGRIETKNGQDCVFCCCGRYQYNAPKTETGREVRSVSTVHENIKPNQRARILMRSNGRCELCGKRGEGVILHVGHICSVKAAFDTMTDSEINDDENLVALCDACNLGIGDEPMPARFLMQIVRERIVRRGQKCSK